MDCFVALLLAMTALRLTKSYWSLTREGFKNPLAVGNPIDRACEIVGDEQRAVTQLGDSDRPTVIFAVAVQPPLGKRLRAFGRRAVVLDLGDHHARADGNGAIPRTVLGRED